MATSKLKAEQLQNPSGAKARVNFVETYAALKDRSSTVVHTFVRFSESCQAVPFPFVEKLETFPQLLGPSPFKTDL